RQGRRRKNRRDLRGALEDVRTEALTLRSASIQARTFADECLQRGRVDGIVLMEIDRTHRLAVETGVEESLRIFQPGALWERQSHRVLEGLADAHDAVVGPDRHPLGPGWLLPLHFFDHPRVGRFDEDPQLPQLLT